MKIYPPYKIFLNFALIFICIALFFLIVPGQKYNINHLLPGNKTLEADASFRTHRPPELSGLISHPADEPLTILDTVAKKPEFVLPDFVNPIGIEYPNGNDTILYPFMRSIRNIKRYGGQTRIMYYGDSQLEGDRITRFFRARMQTRYGGSSPMDQSLVSDSSIFVYNSAQRGSAGLKFSKDSSLLEQFLSKDIYPDLIILQFGINVVPARKEDFTYYKNYLKKEIRYLQQRVPRAPILIIGVSDMGHLVDGKPVPYSSVEKISIAQQKTAEETGAAFYDLLSFMGGPGSFMRWMEEDPPLIRRDYTHFSNTGGAVMAEGLARALIAEVDRYIGQEDDGN